jgi:ElaB/YqjD/DUF883 family membrane-anchored ribosome-binding protein
MTEQANEQPKVATQETDTAKQIQEFVEDYPLLSLAFVVAAGYAVGRLISRL